MRITVFAPGEYYHLCGRGSEGKNIFEDSRDYARFLFLLLYLQSPTPINNIGWYTHRYDVHGDFGINEKTTQKIIRDRYIELTAFCLMPNHFHILIKNLEDSVASVYMHRVLTAYSKYFNAKYKKKGHLFQGPFVSVHTKKNEQLLHLSAYIHKNPKSLSPEAGYYDEYAWSSCSDYLRFNRWDKLLDTSIIQKQFSSQSAYKHFLETSTAKDPISKPDF